MRLFNVGKIDSRNGVKDLKINPIRSNMSEISLNLYNP